MAAWPTFRAAASQRLVELGLLLVRALARQRDSALRITLGAPRRRIVSLWLSESALLAGAGLLGGLMLAWWGTRALAQLAPASTPQLDRITLTWTGMVFAGIVGLLSAIVCGLVPAWMALRLKLRASLQDGAHGSESRSRRQARHALVVGQLALAMVLLVGAGLMIRSVLVLRHLDLGYAPSEVLTIEVTARTEADARAAKEAPPAPADGSLEAISRAYLERVRREEVLMQPYRIAYDQILARIRALPQVQAAGGTYQLPLIYGPIGMDASILLEGQAPFPARDWMKNPTVNQMSVTEGYFEAMGVRLLKGRLFTVGDTAVSSPVVIVGETAAQRLFRGRDPIGRQLSVAGAPRDSEGNARWQTVVGVVSDSHLRGINDVRLDVYMPHQQVTQRVNAIVLRTAADPAAITATVRAAILAVDPRAVIGRVQRLDAIVGTATAPWHFGMLLFTVLAGVAFTLALTGLFGVIAYSVAQRHPEIAIRLALGALPGQVHVMILREGAMLILVGLALGLLGAFAGARALASVLFGISPTDPPTFVAVLAFVTLLTLAACLRGGRPQVDSKYLLPGLARCAVCNGGLFVRTGNTGSGDRRRRAFAYACTSHHTRGRSVCANRVQMPMTLVDEAVLTKLRDEVVTPDLVDDVVARVRELLEEDRRPSTLRDRLVDELAGVNRRLENLVEAIALGGQLPALVTRVQEVEARRQELAERLRMIGEGPMVPRVDWRATERQARQLLVDWRGVLSRHPQEARPLLRELLAGEPLRFTPIDESTRRGYRFEGSAVIGGLLEGVVVTNGNWRPHRDSHPMGIVFYRVFRAA